MDRFRAGSGISSLGFQIVAGFLVLGLIPYGLLWGYGEPLFVFVLGEDWALSGHLAGILAMAVLLEFVYVPLSAVFRVTGHASTQFVLDLLGVSCVILTYLLLAGSLTLPQLLSQVALVLVAWRGLQIAAALYVTVTAGKPV